MAGGRAQRHSPVSLPYLEPQPWQPGAEQSCPGGGGRRRAPCSGPDCSSWGPNGLIWAPQFPQACGRSCSCGASRGHGTGTRGLSAQRGHRHLPQGGAGPHTLLLLLFLLPPPPPPCRGGWPPGTCCRAQGSCDRAPRGAMSWMRPLQSIIGYGKWPGLFTKPPASLPRNQLSPDVREGKGSRAFPPPPTHGTRASIAEDALRA